LKRFDFNAGLALLAAAAFICTTPARAQDPMVTAIEAPAEPNAIPLGTGGLKNATAPESWFRQYGVPMARNVSTATLTPFLPDPDKATGAAVIVAPGGAFLLLSMENEGWRVARALADRGIAAFVLKYRLRPTPPKLEDFDRQLRQAFAAVGESTNRASPDAAVAGLNDQIADAVAAAALIRSRAKEWRVDPKRLGMMGFSAGAMTTMVTTLSRPEVDFAFIAPIYGSMERVTVPANAPPMFGVIASDDPLFARKGFGLLDAWQEADRPVEFHLYEKGGHGFGLGKQGTTSTGWLDLFVRWLDTRGILKPQ
jgi:acetyl esterase/lipase